MIKRLFLCAILCAIAAPSFAQDAADNWGNWRGPDYTGVAPQGNPPTTWDEQTNVKWKVAIPGEGSGSPIVWGDRIYLLTAIKTDRTAEQAAGLDSESPFRLAVGDAREHAVQLVQTEEGQPQGDRPRRRGRGGRGGGFGRGGAPTNFYQFVVMCLNRNTGEVVWQDVAAEVIPHEGRHGTASFASSSPVTDGKNLYVSFGSRGVYSYTLDGEQRWHKDLGQMRIRNSFGEGASPALYGDTLIVNWDHEGDSFITALDANTGNERWKVARDEGTTWLTPLIVEHNGTVQVIVNGSNRTRSYDLTTGEVIWECGGQADGPVPTAIVYQDTVFAMTGHRGSALKAISLDSRGDVTDSEQIEWSKDRDTPYVPSPILYDDLLYYTKSNDAILTCVAAADGTQQYGPSRLPALESIYASPVGAAEKIYFCGRSGATVVVKYGPEFEILAENKLDETIDATPAIVGDSIYIRTAGHLYCIAE